VISEMEYFGRGAYGIRTAAFAYFGEDIEQLDLAEVACLVGLPQQPARLDPACFPEAAKARRGFILRLMRGGGLITQEQMSAASLESFKVLPRKRGCPD